MTYRDRLPGAIFKRVRVKPWMADREIAVIDDVLAALRPARALEWGAGFSTLYFSRWLATGGRWIAVEHQKEWAATVRRLLDSRPVFRRRRRYEWTDYYLRGQLSRAGHGLLDPLVRAVIRGTAVAGGVEVYHVPANRLPCSDEHNDGSPTDFADYLALPERFGPFDLVLVDGRARRDCLRRAYDLVRDEGVVVLHDANRTYLHEPFDLYAHQILFSDSRRDEGGVWIGSKGIPLASLCDMDAHTRRWSDGGGSAVARHGQREGARA